MKPFFICEAGINHNGNLRAAFEQVRLAAELGADVVKFQYYDPLKLLGKDSPYLQYATQCQFTKGDHEAIKLQCDHFGIPYAVSVFDIADVEWASGLSAFMKVASRMNQNADFIAACVKTGKPVIISLQARTPHLITDKFRYMWCVPKYPSSMEDYANFLYNENYGISSHCPNPEASIQAARKGARVFENHFTLSRSLEGCDQACSLEPVEYGNMISTIREICNVG